MTTVHVSSTSDLGIDMAAAEGQPQPLIDLLPPPEGLLYDHHGPSSSKVALDGEKPRYFQNPWKSWRQPSLGDAWIAYQKGASIALPLQKPHSSQEHDRANDLADGLDSSPDDSDDEAGETTKAIPDPTDLKTVPSRYYVRPEFSSVQHEEDLEHWHDQPVEVVSPRWDRQDQVDVTWLGHASSFIRIPWKNAGGESRPGACGILFDPIFSYRCSPSQYVGPARYLDPPCTVAELPAIHICCISHDHYDHLDYYTILELWKAHKDTIQFFVPLGLARWFISSGIPEDRVTELDWWHEVILSYPFPSTPEMDGAEAALNLKLVCCPAQHRSGRGVRDHMTTLWASWCLGVIDDADLLKASERGMRGWKGFKLYFGGDTGYRYATAPDDDSEAVCPAFQEIADLYAPISLCLLPISTGSSLPFLRTVLSLSLDQYTLTSSQHCSPRDALELHKIMKAERSLGIHWGTFCDADEARGTQVDFGRGRRERGIGKNWENPPEAGSFVTSNIGQTLSIPPSVSSSQ